MIRRKYVLLYREKKRKIKKYNGAYVKAKLVKLKFLRFINIYIISSIKVPEIESRFL